MTSLFRDARRAIARATPPARGLAMTATSVSCGTFCSACGDCLHCYGEDSCLRAADGQHVARDAGVALFRHEVHLVGERPARGR